MMNNLKIACIGQLTWDIYPDSRFIGGSSANVALNCHYLGLDSTLISKTGSGSNGIQLLSRLKNSGLSTEYIQIDSQHETAIVYVEINENGEPHYICNTDSAFDYIEYDSNLHDLAHSLDVLYFDILSQRNRVSRTSIQKLVEDAVNALKVCDLNIRGKPDNAAAYIVQSLRMTNILKINRSELNLLIKILSSENIFFEHDPIEKNIHIIMNLYEIDHVIYSHDNTGFSLFTKSDCINFPPVSNQIIDTNGAGDALVSAYMVGFLNQNSQIEIASHCDQFVSKIVTSEGPNLY